MVLDAKRQNATPNNAPPVDFLRDVRWLAFGPFHRLPRMGGKMDAVMSDIKQTLLLKTASASAIIAHEGFLLTNRFHCPSERNSTWQKLSITVTRISTE